MWRAQHMPIRRWPLHEGAIASRNVMMMGSQTLMITQRHESMQMAARLTVSSNQSDKRVA
jgi:hypothetical protein